MVRIEHPDAIATQLEYNAQRHPTRITDGNNLVSVFERDSNGSLVAFIDPTSGRTTYLYDDNDRLKQVENPIGGIDLFAYNTINKLASHTGPSGNATT